LGEQEFGLQRTATQAGQFAGNDNIASLRSTDQFTRIIFVRAPFDYETIDSPVAGQFLFWLDPRSRHRPLGWYDDDLVRHGFSHFTGQIEHGIHRNGRPCFIKLSYLFRKSFGG
jgi:hypothetical protein